MRRILRLIDHINDQVGKLISLLVIFMVGIMVYEVVARYVFDSPTIWAYETITFLLAGYAILGGAYVLRHGAHVNMDILYRRLSPRKQAILDLVTSGLFFLFCAVLIWKGSEWASRSIRLSETTTSTWAPVVYPIKMAIPVGAFLLLIQGLAKFIRDLMTAVTGERPE
ncbi:MAG: TRAP transporter small permease subunit [Dehalococcoidia bacterium]|nr:MAG: TRAP transporter small permease subunit [Dehalococcoidia bacterium]